jgi:hypothetical protein
MNAIKLVVSLSRDIDRMGYTGRPARYAIPRSSLPTTSRRE